MSDVIATPAATPVTIDTKTAPAAHVPPAAAPSPQGEPSDKPAWLDARLERERRSVLKELGIENLDDGKKALGELRAKQDAEKTAAQKLAELEGTVKATKAERDEYASALAAHAKTQLAGLTEAQRAAVLAVAGDNAAQQIKTIAALAPTWAGAAASAATPAAPAATAAPAKPADTAPAPSAPQQQSVGSPPDPKAIYAELKKTNPVVAARYAIANGIHD